MSEQKQKQKPRIRDGSASFSPNASAPTSPNTSVPTSPTGPQVPVGFAEGVKNITSTTSGRRAFTEKKDMFLTNSIASCTVPKYVDIELKLGNNRVKQRTYYVISIETEAGHSWMVSRTYTDFSDLFNAVKSNPILGAFEFPSKDFGTSSELKENRRQQFDQLINLVVHTYQGSKRSPKRNPANRQSFPLDIASFFLPGTITSCKVDSYLDRVPVDEERKTNTLATALAGGFRTFYQIKLTNDAGIEWTVDKTYSDFSKLYEELMDKAEGLDKEKAKGLEDFKFPGKAYMCSSNKRILQDRLLKFEWLSKLCVSFQEQTPEIWAFFHPHFN